MMAFEQGDIRRAFTYLESGAVLLITTSNGVQDNVMTISWQMVMEHSSLTESFVIYAI